MEREELRLGTIGSGTIVHHILDQVQKTLGICLAAVYSRREDTGRALAAQYGPAAVYTDLERFLDNPDLDLVYIATPNLLHYAQTKQALLAGKHVLCEKPFCPQASQARELAALARDKGCFLIEAVPTTYLPNYQVLKGALGQIGPVKLILANYSKLSSRYGRLQKGERSNIFDPAMGGGCLMDINYYNAYLTVALFGTPKHAAYHPNLHPCGVDTSGVLHLDYGSFLAECAGAKDTWGYNFYQIEGERGFLHVKDGSNGLAEIRIVTEDSEQTVNLQPVPDRWFYEVQAVTALLRQGDAGALSSRLALTCQVVELVEAVRKNAGIFFPGDT